jgi:hypothetical protein
MFPNINTEVVNVIDGIKFSSTPKSFQIKSPSPSECQSQSISSRSKMKSWITDSDDDSDDEDDKSSFEPLNEIEHISSFSNIQLNFVNNKQNFVNPLHLVEPIISTSKTINKKNIQFIDNNLDDEILKQLFEITKEKNNQKNIQYVNNNLDDNIIKQLVEKTNEKNIISSNIRKIDVLSLFNKKDNIIPDNISKSSDNISKSSDNISKSSDTISNDIKKNDNFFDIKDYDNINILNIDEFLKFENELDNYLSKFSFENKEITLFFKERLIAFFKILLKYTTIEKKHTINLGYVSYILNEKLCLKKLDKEKYNKFYCHILFTTYENLNNLKKSNKNCYLLNNTNNYLMNIFLENNNKILPIDFILKYFLKIFNIKFTYSMKLNNNKEDFEKEIFIYFTGYTKNN